jgi:hypothetical protein
MLVTDPSKGALQASSNIRITRSWLDRTVQLCTLYLASGQSVWLERARQDLYDAILPLDNWLGWPDCPYPNGTIGSSSYSICRSESVMKLVIVCLFTSTVYAYASKYNCCKAVWPPNGQSSVLLKLADIKSILSWVCEDSVLINTITRAWGQVHILTKIGVIDMIKNILICLIVIIMSTESLIVIIVHSHILW